MVEYKKGRDNKAADALSQTMEGVLNSMVSVSADTDEDNDLGYANQNVALFLISFPCPSWLSILQDSYLNEQEYRHLLLLLAIIHLQGSLCIMVLFCTSALSPLKPLVLQHMHNSPLGGQSGYLKTLHKVKQDFFWRGTKSDALSHIKRCETC